MKKLFLRIYAICFLLVLILSSIPASSAEKVNLFDPSLPLKGTENATLEGGVFKLTNSNGGHLALLTVPKLINQYSWSGDVKIIEYGNDAKSNGVRLCIGYSEESNKSFLDLLITQSMGISAELTYQGGFESDVYPVTKDAF